MSAYTDARKRMAGQAAAPPIAAMTRTKAHRILDALRYGGAQPSAELIDLALIACGDLAAESPPLPPETPPSVVRTHLNAGTRVMRDRSAPEPMPAPAGCAWDRPAEGWIDLRRWRQ